MCFALQNGQSAFLICPTHSLHITCPHPSFPFSAGSLQTQQTSSTDCVCNSVLVVVSGGTLLTTGKVSREKVPFFCEGKGFIFGGDTALLSTGGGVIVLVFVCRGDLGFFSLLITGRGGGLFPRTPG